MDRLKLLSKGKLLQDGDKPKGLQSNGMTTGRGAHWFPCSHAAPSVEGELDKLLLRRHDRCGGGTIDADCGGVEHGRRDGPSQR